MDTPDIVSPPLWTVFRDASAAMVGYTMAGDEDGAEWVARKVVGQYGSTGLFALCAGVAVGCVPFARLDGFTVVREGSDGTAEIADVEEVPFVVRFMGRFVLAVVSRDIDSAWAHWLTIPDDDTRELVVSHLCIFAAQAMAMEEDSDD